MRETLGANHYYYIILILFLKGVIIIKHELPHKGSFCVIDTTSKRILSARIPCSMAVEQQHKK
jgi:hypothetical protein